MMLSLLITISGLVFSLPGLTREYSTQSQLVEAVPGTSLEVQLDSKGKNIILLKAESETVLDSKKLSNKAAASSQLLVTDFYDDDQYEAVVITKRGTKQIKLYLLSINTSTKTLRLLDTQRLEKKYVIPTNTRLKNKSIRLRNTLDEVIATLRVKTNNSLHVINTDLPTRIELGDDHVVTSSARKGYVLSCGDLAGSGGAVVDGPWIDGEYWDYSKKDVSVDGEVNWPQAETSIDEGITDRTIVGNGLSTNHPTGVFPIAPTDDAYAYDRNPNLITEQAFDFSIPNDPTLSDSPTCVVAQVGIALNGVALFSALDEEQRDAVAHEIQDNFGGHPQQQGIYHYHTMADSVAQLVTKSHGMKLVGYAFDGFGIFGETEFGKTLRTADLDVCHGHTHQITWDGELQEMYHYHITKDFPYTVGCFKGEPSISQL